MSGIGGKVRVQPEFTESKKYVGIFCGNVVAINPTAEEYKELTGIELKEDSKLTEYIGESKDGNVTVRINFWVQDDKTGVKLPVPYFLEDKVRTNKNGDKTQYINSQGASTWAEDESKLGAWFIKHEYRECHAGEADMYDFLRTWLSGIDFKDDPDASLDADWKKLMKNNTKALKDLIGSAYAKKVAPMATIRSVDKDGEWKEYQGVWNKMVLPEYAVKQIRLVDYTRQDILDNIAKKPQKEQKAHEKFVLAITNSEYGCKDFYKLKDLKEYDPSENIMTKDDPILQENNSATDDLPF